MSLSELHRRAGSVLPEDVLKPTLIHLLLALDFLHTEAKIVHTGTDPAFFFLIPICS